MNVIVLVGQVIELPYLQRRRRAISARRWC